MPAFSYVSRTAKLFLLFVFVAWLYPLSVAFAQMLVMPRQTLERDLADLQQEWEETVAEGTKIPRHIHVRAKRLRAALCEQGKQDFCEEPKKVWAGKNVDINKLAYAVAVAETSNCTAGTGKSKNNCHGIFGCVSGKCGPRTFKTTEESFEVFKELWLTKYGDRFPTLEDAQRYSAGPGDSWLNRVTVAYHREVQR